MGVATGLGGAGAAPPHKVVADALVGDGVPGHALAGGASAGLAAGGDGRGRGRGGRGQPPLRSGRGGGIRELGGQRGGGAGVERGDHRLFRVVRGGVGHDGVGRSRAAGRHGWVAGGRVGVASCLARCLIWVSVGVSPRVGAGSGVVLSIIRDAVRH